MLFIEEIIEIKRVLFVLQVWPLIFYLGLFIILRFKMLLKQCFAWLIFQFVILFSISIHVNFGKALIFVVKIDCYFLLPICKGKRIIFIYLWVIFIFLFDYLFNWFVLIGRQFLITQRWLTTPFYLLNHRQKIELLWAHILFLFRQSLLHTDYILD